MKSDPLRGLVLTAGPHVRLDREARLVYSPAIEKLIHAARELPRDFDSCDEKTVREAIGGVVDAIENIDEEAKRFASGAQSGSEET